MYNENAEPWAGLRKDLRLVMKPLLLVYCYDEICVVDDSFVRGQDQRDS